MTALQAILCCITLALTTAVDARPVKQTRPAKRAVTLDKSLVTLTSDSDARLAQWRATRWGLAENDLSYDDGSNPDAVSVRWRFNKVRMKVPFSTAP